MWDAREFVTKRKVTVKNLKSPNKEDVKFDAIIHIIKNEETGYWNYKMEFDNKKKSKPSSKPKSSIKFKSSKY